LAMASSTRFSYSYKCKNAADGRPAAHFGVGETNNSRNRVGSLSIGENDWHKAVCYNSHTYRDGFLSIWKHLFRMADENQWLRI
jgi:hypothetical protein